ncbi:unnamed protein product [Angiostrongylus costaricensis]|uniref:Kinesin motor domain-containing protein n=1 Tax=Angiostrongylus costaricensis TaxID=334426 RepID=A0A0R3PLJ4_ANGCS|nr:unnamed protein product [Angiostrongylus costaricensis]
MNNSTRKDSGSSRGAVDFNTRSSTFDFQHEGNRIVDGCVDGYNILGQTGPRKTYTMFGPPNAQNCLLDCHHRDLMPHTCGNLNFEGYQQNCRNEVIRSVQSLGVWEHRLKTLLVLEIGWEARRTAETAMNRESSRSHSILIVKTNELVNGIVNKKCATLNIVDSVNINLVKSCLSFALYHTPYRDSELTHILRDSLRPNSREEAIVNTHPDKGYYTSLSMLQFAAACRKIGNRVCANEDLAAGTVMAHKCDIARLREEFRSTRPAVLISLVHLNYEFILY